MILVSKNNCHAEANMRGYNESPDNQQFGAWKPKPFIFFIYYMLVTEYANLTSYFLTSRTDK